MPDVEVVLPTTAGRVTGNVLAINSDVISDTPTTRLALRSFNAFATEATRAWLMGECEREDTEKLLVTAFRHLLLETIPELERGR